EALIGADLHERAVLGADGTPAGEGQGTARDRVAEAIDIDARDLHGSSIRPNQVWYERKAVPSRESTVAAPRQLIGQYMAVLLTFVAFTDGNSVLFPQYFVSIIPFIVLRPASWPRYPPGRRPARCHEGPASASRTARAACSAMMP